MENEKVTPSPEALFRYQVISKVLLEQTRGRKRSKAVRIAAENEHMLPDGTLRKVSKRSIYRWLEAYEMSGFSGLLPAERKRTRASVVIESELLEFFAQQKKDDPMASVPELLRRAYMLGKVDTQHCVNRVTLWRALNRMGIDTSHRKSVRNRDCRRFAFAHRMDMVLCDGKHFRAGVKRLKRVAFFFLDDATRKGLNVVVGTSENPRLFLRGLYETIKAYGLMSCIYVDKGSGFMANDCIDILRKLNILFIHGTKGYPEGRGKIERFNRTANDQAIRFLDNNPEVDPDCSALELRLRHYLSEQYNLTPHESLKKQKPWDCFHNDAKSLRFAHNHDQLRQSFVLYTQRRVSFDNVVSFKGQSYEVARGYAGTRVMLCRNVLDNSVSMIHNGRLVKVSPVDLNANARDRRASAKGEQDSNERGSLPKSCAQMAFERDYGPVVDSDGGLTRQINTEKEDKS